MVVKGGHLEDALAVGGFEVDDLDDVREGLGDVDDAHQDEDQGHVEGEGQAAHGDAQEEGAGVAHKDLGGVVVIEEEGAQAAEEGAAEDPQVVDAPVPGHSGEEGGHGQGDAGAQAVHAVGDVDGVDGAHHDEGGEGHIDHPGQLDGDLEEGDVQVGGQVAEIPQQGGEGDGGGQLEKELGTGGEAGVLPLLHLLIVVQIANDAEDQGKAEDEEGTKIPPEQVGPADEHNGDQNTEDEHQSAHGGGALLGHVPGGAVLLDGLAGLHPAQHGDEQLAGHGRQHKGTECSDQDPHIFNLLGKFPKGDYTTARGIPQSEKSTDYSRTASFFLKTTRLAKWSATTSRSSRCRRSSPTSW